jgi:hypothetical protein
MFTAKIPENTRKLLGLLAPVLPQNSYLAGGTALALHLNHRSSYDLDLYSPKQFIESQQVQRFETLPEFKLVETSWQTVMGRSGDTDISLFYYQYPHLQPPVEFNQLPIASMTDIAAMKLEAISTRGLKRDFFDLYSICQHQNTTPEIIMQLATKKFNHDQSYLPYYLRSLTYFVEAETMPERAQIVDEIWEKVKAYFISETVKASKKILT